MLRSLVLGTVLFTMLITTAQAVTLGRGKKGRKQLRYLTYQTILVNDKREILETYGYTPHRLRERWPSGVVERWIYHPLGLEFVFDENSELIEVKEYTPISASYRAPHVEAGGRGW